MQHKIKKRLKKVTIRYFKIVILTGFLPKRNEKYQTHPYLQQSWFQLNSNVVFGTFQRTQK